MTTSKQRAQERRDREDRLNRDLERHAIDVQERLGLTSSRAVALTLARDAMFRDQLASSIKQTFARGRVVAPRYIAKKKKRTERVLNLLWSDLHFGAMLDGRELPVAFGHVEEARRLAAIAVQAAEYKRDHRAETKLVINLAGDIIQNQLHDPRDGAPLAEQMSGALYILTQAIAFLAGEFKAVEVHCTPGNHGRNKARHEKKATNQKWDSLENVIYFSLKMALAHVPNVSFDIPYTPFYVYDVFGQHIFVTHGDTVFKPGYPGKSIQVESIKEQANDFNAGRDDDEKVQIFCCGHVHAGALVPLDNNVNFISNGCLIPPDGFAQSIGVHKGRQCQAMWESVPGHVLGDCRFVDLDESIDRDKKLDKIITPFEGF